MEGEGSDAQLPLFEGVRFTFYGYMEQQIAELRSALIVEGAVEAEESAATHLITRSLYDDPRCVQARQAGLTVVRDLWVQHCLKHQDTLNPHQAVYEPPRQSGPLPGAEAFQISLTGYKGPQRSSVMALCEQMGAQFTKELSASNTHLICYEHQGTKFGFAQDRGMHLVNHRWLEDSLRLGALQPEERYTEQSGQDIEEADAVLQEAPPAPQTVNELEVEQLRSIPVPQALSPALKADKQQPEREDEHLPEAQNQSVKKNDPAEESLGRTDRRGGWEKAGATVRVQKGLGYLAGNAQPPGWGEANTNEDSVAAKGVQRYVEDEEKQDGLEESGCSKGKGEKEEIKQVQTVVQEVAKAKEEEGEPAEKKRKAGRLRKADTGGKAETKEGGRSSLADEEEELPKRSAKKQGRRRVQIDSDEDTQSEGKEQAEPSGEGNEGSRFTRETGHDAENVSPLMREEPQKGDEKCEEAGSQDEDMPLVQRKAPTKRQQRASSEDEVIAQIPTGNKRRKAVKKSDAPKGRKNEPVEEIGQAVVAPKKEVEGFEAGTGLENDGHECAQQKKQKKGTKEARSEEQPKLLQQSGPKSGEEMGIEKAEEEDKAAIEEGNDAEVACMEDAGLMEAPVEREKSSQEKAAMQRGPAKNALIRAKPKAIVRQVGRGPNRAFRPPAMVTKSKGKETDKEKEGAPHVGREKLEGNKAGKKNLEAAKEGTRDDIQGASNDDEPNGADDGQNEQVGGNEEQNEHAQEPEKKEGATTVGAPKSDGADLLSNLEQPAAAVSGKKVKVTGQGSKRKKTKDKVSKEKAGKKKRKLASNDSLGVGRESEEGVTPCKRLSQEALLRKESEMREDTDAMNEAGGGAESEGEPAEKEKGTEPLAKKSAAIKRKPQIGERTDSAVADGNGGENLKESESGSNPEKKRKANAPAAKHGKVVKKAVASTECEANKENIAAGQSQGAEAKIGPSPSKEQRKARYFAFGGTGEEKEALAKKAKALGGRLSKAGHDFDPRTTHVVHPPPLKRTEKVLAALAGGLWLLQPSFLTAPKTSNGWPPESDHEWTNNGGEVGPSLDLAAPRHWRLQKATRGCGAIHGLLVLLYGEFQTPSTETLQRILKAGGAQVVLPGAKLPRGTSVDIAIIAEGVLRGDALVGDLPASGVGCVSAAWVLDLLSQPSADRAGHVLWGTEEAVAAAYAKISTSHVKGSAPKDATVGKKEGGTSASQKKATAKERERMNVSKHQETEGPLEEDDVACGVCGRVDGEECMLLCDGKGGTCEVAVHTFCMVPPLERVPEGDWFCVLCCTDQKDGSP